MILRKLFTSKLLVQVLLLALVLVSVTFLSACNKKDGTTKMTINTETQNDEVVEEEELPPVDETQPSEAGSTVEGAQEKEESSVQDTEEAQTEETKEKVFVDIYASIKDVNAKAIRINLRSTQSNVLTINDIDNPDTFIVDGAEDDYTYYLAIEGNNTLQFRTDKKTEIEVLSGGRYGLRIGLSVEKWKLFAKKLIFKIVVADGDDLYASRVISLSRAGDGDLFSWSDMNIMTRYPSLDYVLQNDIVIPSGASKSLGSKTEPFYGSLNGQGHSIKNFNISKETDNVGLFANIANARIGNLRLENISVSGKDFVGGLAGVSTGSIVTRVYVEGRVVGQRSVGGILGEMSGGSEGSQVNMVYMNGIVSGNKDVGGIIGSAEKVRLSNALMEGEMLGKDTAGGILGISTESSIHTSYVGAIISGTVNTGVLAGIVGFQSEQAVVDSYFIKDFDEGINGGYEAAGYEDFDADVESAFSDIFGYFKDETLDKNNFYGFDFENTWTMTGQGPRLNFATK